MSLSIYHTHTHSLGHMSERQKLLGSERETTAIKRSSLCFQVLLLVLILSLRKLWGFLLYGFPKEKHCVHCLLCLIVVLAILLLKILSLYCLNDKNLTKVSTLEEHDDLKMVRVDELHGILTAYEMVKHPLSVLLDFYHSS